MPETSRYTLEELDNVFGFMTKDIINNGWAQMRWLLTGGWVRGREYPELVLRQADRYFNDYPQEPVEMDSR